MRNLNLTLILVCLLMLDVSTKAQTQSFTSNLYIISGDGTRILADGNLAKYGNYSDSVDDMDALKLINQDENFGLSRDSILLSIERRRIINLADTLYFKLFNYRHTAYTFKFSAVGLNHPDLMGMLIDNYTQSKTPVNLNGTTSVDFTIDPNIPGSVDSLRFRVVFGMSSMTLPVSFSAITAIQQNQAAQVNWSVENQADTKQYIIERSTNAVDFETVAAVNSIENNNEYSWTDLTVNAGTYFYRVKSMAADGSFIYSHIVTVKILAGKQVISIYPNPVQTGVVNLVFTNMPAGVYTIILSDLAGQVLTKTQIIRDGETNRQTINLPPNMQNGIYQIEAIAPDNSRQVLKLLCY